MISVWAFIFIFNSVVYVRAQVNDPSNPISSDELKNTIITPVIDAKIEKGKNLVFCSTLQMAWNKLCKDIAEGPLNVNDPPWYVASLNKLIDQPALLSEDAYFTMAGLKKDNIVEKINKGLREKFKHLKEEELVTVTDSLKYPNDIMAFAYLNKNLEFETPFYKTIPMDIEKKNDENVKIRTFGVEKFDLSIPAHQKLLKQIKLLYCNVNEKRIADKPEGFIIALKTKSETDELIISTLKPAETLEKTYREINYCIESNKNSNADDVIASMVVPSIKFNFIHQFKELIEKELLSTKLSNKYTFGEVIQNINFILNEHGAKLISYALITMLTGRPTEIRLDVKLPFVVLLKSKGYEMPYFIAYIDNEELLETINPELIPIYTNGDALGGVLDYTSEVNISISQAILNGARKEAIQKMIKSGADINAIDKYGERAIKYAFEHYDYEIIKLLLENNADVSTTGCELLRKSLANSIDYLMTLVLKEHNKEHIKNSSQNISIEDFIAQHDLLNTSEVIQRLDKTHKVIQLLLKSKIDNLNFNDVISLLLSGHILFPTASFEKIVAEFVNAGADINQSNKAGETLLMLSIKKKMSIEFIKKLIEKGADIKATDKKGHDALYYAKENKMDDVIKWLSQGQN